MRANAAAANARVLPLPVRAWAITSLPLSKTGKACACTGVMSVKPRTSIALASDDGRDTVEKAVIAAT